MAEFLRLLPTAALGSISGQIVVYGSRGGIHSLGKPSIWQPTFYPAKISMSFSFGLLLPYPLNPCSVPIGLASWLEAR